MDYMTEILFCEFGKNFGADGIWSLSDVDSGELIGQHLVQDGNTRKWDDKLRYTFSSRVCERTSSSLLVDKPSVNYWPLRWCGWTTDLPKRKPRAQCRSARLLDLIVIPHRMPSDWTCCWSVFKGLISSDVYIDFWCFSFSDDRCRECFDGFCSFTKLCTSTYNHWHLFVRVALSDCVDQHKQGNPYCQLNPVETPEFLEESNAVVPARNKSSHSSSKRDRPLSCRLSRGECLATSNQQCANWVRCTSQDA